MTGNTKMVRDALGSPVPQTLNTDGTYTVLANGATTGINFSKYKLLRDALGSPLPYQYFDVVEGKFVAGTIGGGSGGAVDSVNGKTGIVNLIASDVGAASATDLTTLSQTVQELANGNDLQALSTSVALYQQETTTTLNETNNTLTTLGSRVTERLGDIAINAKDFGAIGDGVADDTVAIQTAANFAFAQDVNATLLIPNGKYRTTGTIMIKCQLEATQATIQYYGTGTAIKLGDDSSPNIVTARLTFKLPRVINMNRGTNGWDGTSEGVKTINLNTCDVYVPFVQDFEKGLIVFGNDGGHAYVTFYLGALWENRKNLVLDCTPTGYVNQNLFLNGRLQHSTTKGATLNDMNANQISLVGQNSFGGPNNNTFINTSIEGQNVSYYRVEMSGSYNQFYNCRWESPGNEPLRVRYSSGATNNRIDGGYGSVNIVEVFDGSLGGGAIFDHFGSYTSANATAGQLIPNNVWTTINSWTNPVSRRITYASDTGEFTPRPGRWNITATVTFAPNATGRRIARLNVGGSIIDISEVQPSANRTVMKVQGAYRFNGAQTFKLECNQTSGADLALETSPPYVRIQAEYLGV